MNKSSLKLKVMTVHLSTIPLPAGVIDTYHRWSMVIFVLFFGYEKWQMNEMKKFIYNRMALVI